MRRGIPLFAAAALVLVSLPEAVSAADKMVDNPPFKHWSAFKVGASVTQIEKIRFAKGSDEAEYYPGGVSMKETTYKLIESSPSKVVVESTLIEHGHGSVTEHAPTKITYFPKVVEEHVKTSKEQIEQFKEGDESVTVAGKSIPCHWVDLMDVDGDESFEHKMWTSDDVPGGIVKDMKVTKKNKMIVSESEITVAHVKKP